MYKNYIQIMY